MERPGLSSVRYKPERPDGHGAVLALPFVSAETTSAPDTSTYEFYFKPDKLSIILSRSGSRERGETNLEGLPTCRSQVFRNTCLVVPAGTVLRGWSSPAQRHEYVSLEVGMGRLDVGSSSLELADVRPEVCFEDDLLTAAAHAFDKELRNPGGYGRLLLDTLTDLVLIRVLSRNAGGLHAARAARGGLSMFNLRLTTDYMRDHLGENTPLATLAGLAGLSVSHFSRAFRASTGFPPHLWLRRERIDRGKDLLRRRDLTISEVAGACGFADQSHFTRVFHSVTGTTPFQWRRDGSTLTKEQRTPPREA